MEINKRVQAWKFLEGMIEKILDEMLRNAYLSEFARRAEEEWGFCPSVKKIEKKEVELEDWEKAFLEDMEVGLKYGVVIKNEEVHKDNRIFMMRFVREGHSLSEIPERERTQYVRDLYWDCMKKYGEELMELADSVM